MILQYSVGKTIVSKIWDSRTRINELLTETDNQDITVVYNNLNKGSRNHLRAFVAQIENRGGSYSPPYISQTEFNAIVSSDQEKGQVN